MEHAEISPALFAASKRFVDEHYDTLKEDCLNDALGNSVYDIYYRVYCRHSDPADAYDCEIIDIISDYVIYLLEERGYTYDREELCYKCLDCYNRFANTFHQRFGYYFGAVELYDGHYEAWMIREGKMTHFGVGDTPQGALDDMRLVVK